MSAGLASDWWKRPVPMQSDLAQRAVAFGNDPTDVARWFADEANLRSGIFCRVCRLPIRFCQIEVLGVETRCWERPSTGMPEDNFFYEDYT